jgi:hypothetical protein
MRELLHDSSVRGFEPTRAVGRAGGRGRDARSAGGAVRTLRTRAGPRGAVRSHCPGPCAMSAVALGAQRRGTSANHLKPQIVAQEERTVVMVNCGATCYVRQLLEEDGVGGFLRAFCGAGWQQLVWAFGCSLGVFAGSTNRPFRPAFCRTSLRTPPWIGPCLEVHARTEPGRAHAQTPAPRRPPPPPAARQINAANVRFVVIDSHRPVDARYNNADDRDHLLLLDGDDPMGPGEVPQYSALDEITEEGGWRDGGAPAGGARRPGRGGTGGGCCPEATARAAAGAATGGGMARKAALQLRHAASPPPRARLAAAEAGPAGPAPRRAGPPPPLHPPPPRRLPAPGGGRRGQRRRGGQLGRRGGRRRRRRRRPRARQAAKAARRGEP